MFLVTNHIAYPSIYYRSIFYLLSAHFLITYGEPENLFQLLKLPYYYFALAGSFAIALITGEFVLIVTRYFDAAQPWFSSFKRRMLLQFVWGVFTAILLAVLLAVAYFLLRGKNIIEERYFKYDFAIVVCFILFLNGFYLIMVLIQNRSYQRKDRIPNKEKSKGISGYNDPDILAIYPIGRGFIAVLKNGESIIWSKTLEQSLLTLPSSEYFLINRSDIVNRSIIEGYEPMESRRLKLILKQPISISRDFMVSQRKVVEFKRWYKHDK